MTNSIIDRMNDEIDTDGEIRKRNVLPKIFSAVSSRAISQRGVSIDTLTDVAGSAHSTMTVINVSSLKRIVIQLCRPPAL